MLEHLGCDDNRDAITYLNARIFVHQSLIGFVLVIEFSIAMTETL